MNNLQSITSLPHPVIHGAIQRLPPVTARALDGDIKVRFFPEVGFSRLVGLIMSSAAVIARPYIVMATATSSGNDDKGEDVKWMMLKFKTKMPTSRMNSVGA